MSGGTQVVDHLFNDHTSVVLAIRNGVPYIAHLGASLGDVLIEPDILPRGVMGGGFDHEVIPALLPLPAHGWQGLPGLEVRRDGVVLQLDLRIVDHMRSADVNGRVFTMHDERHGVIVDIVVALSAQNVVTLSTRVVNNAATPLSVDALHVCVPVAGDADEILTLGGRHAMEAVQQRTAWGRTRQVVENRTGRTSHEQLGTVFVGSVGFSEQRGDVWGLHIAHSGNFRIVCDGITETLRTIHAGELVQPNEIVLQPGESHTSPEVVVSFSSSGMTPASQNFHRHVRSFAATSHRPVVLNTWEAVYFNHDLPTLTRLADAAAAVGIERFVLDDGWFHGRRNDTAGLGDWWVDTAVWPDGLTPLVSHVRSLGMDFGLWFEPEMVNPNSDLYRAHPDWALDGTLSHQILGRHQLVLDLSLPQVRDYLFDKIDAVLSAHDIAYVKWDHNRPLVGGESHAQTRGFTSLLERLTVAHPAVQFESCASGGGRIDMGVARWVKRFWASDSIDALDRLEIQKGLTTFIPPEMLGSHIGSPTCHTTGRKHALSFRATTALFGWLGVEWNLLGLTEKERDGLRNAIEMYKDHRELLHTSDFIRVDHPDDTIDIRGVFDPDTSYGLFSVSRLRSGPNNHSAPIRLPLPDDREYALGIEHLGSPRWALHRALPEWVENGGAIVEGSVLAHIGLPMPSLLPESSFLIHVGQVIY
jgi:alpha-galactosidase